MPFDLRTNDLLPASGFKRPVVEAEADYALAEQDHVVAVVDLLTEGLTFDATLSQTLRWNRCHANF